MSQEQIRLFIAVAAPPPVREAAARVIDRLRGAGDVRWVTPDRLHLTLKFLGETAAENVPRLRDSLAESANKYSRFVVEFGGAGAFPSLRKPRTLWMAVEGGGTEALARLASEIDRAAAGLGFPRETRPYRAHLTLGRVRSSREIAELSRRLAALAQERGPAVEWPVEEFQLVRSRLLPAGPEYASLHHFPLLREE